MKSSAVSTSEVEKWDFGDKGYSFDVLKYTKLIHLGLFFFFF